MKVWIVGTAEDALAFTDQNEAYLYRGKLVARNGHHKNVPIISASWPDNWQDLLNKQETPK